MRYSQKLLDAYGERESCGIGTEEAQAHEVHGTHLRMQRERFFDADAFARFYRDNTMQADIDILRHDMRHGIAEGHPANYRDPPRRVYAVRMQAAVISPSAPLARHPRVPIN